jgi:hypothetical protein
MVLANPINESIRLRQIARIGTALQQKNDLLIVFPRPTEEFAVTRYNGFLVSGNTMLNKRAAI